MSSIAETWVASFAEGWRAPTGPDAFAEHFYKLLAPDVLLIQPQLPTVVGHDAFKEQFVKPVFALIPDLHGEVERWAAAQGCSELASDSPIENVAAHATQDGAAPGRIKFRDVNGDGVIDNSDRTIIGSPHPKFTAGLDLGAHRGNWSRFRPHDPQWPWRETGS